MDNVNYIRISNSLKYIALYWNLGFLEEKHDFFVKKYDGLEVDIDAENQTVDFHNGIDVIGKELILDNHESFVVLELINRLLELGYRSGDIKLCLDDEFAVKIHNLKFKCFAWGNLDPKHKPNDNDDYEIYYESRLVSGCIETNYLVYHKGFVFDEGLFDFKDSLENLRKKTTLEIANKDFITEGTKLIKYVGKDKVVKIPAGITSFGPSVFWDNQNIKEVIIPSSVTNISGDTFYNCFSLERITIPSSVKAMGDNPFAGCPKLELINNSDSFIYENGALFNKNKSVLIYYNIKNPSKIFEIPSTVNIVGKHAFYMSNLEKIVIPNSVYRLANNPFSASKKLHLDNHSNRYNVIDDVIYTSDMLTVVGALNSIDTDCLNLKNVKVISRNAFFNCEGLRKIVFPNTLDQIGYNPFVGCKNIEFESHSKNYNVANGLLYTNNMKKLVCCPRKYAVGDVHLKDSVIELERGCFSGCDMMESISLHNVNIIGKSCFTNCVGLKNVYLSDYVIYVGEWAFAHCKNLETLSCYKDCFIDNRILANTKCKLLRRNNRTNYLVESDNLYTLETLNASLKGRVDSICIDPPYNSHIDYIGYKDGDYKEGYLNFMNSRIKLAFELLSNHGFMIINIDEGEVDDLNKLCSRIFGKNLVSIHRWKKKHPYFDTNRVVLNPNKVQTDFEYVIVCRKTVDAKLNKIKQPYLDGDELKESVADFPETFDCFGTTSSAKDEINNLFGRRDYFSTPKPVKLIKEFVRATTSKDSIVIDFFAGSGTTGHAVDELNKEDGGARKYILISNSESNICKNVTKKRLDLISSNYKFID